MYRAGHPVPRRAYLGAELPADVEAFGDGGVRIAGVLPGGMAAAAGLAAGDVLVGIGGAPVRDREELAAALRQAGARDIVELTAIRVTARVAVVPAPHEPGVTLGELAVAAARLRTLETPGARATVVLLGGIACESLEDGPLAVIAAALARAGYATLRVDKRGVGDSEGGPARDVDFHTELADARAAVRRATQRGLPVVVLGHSIGGVIAAHLGIAVDAIAVYGTPVRPWIDCLLDSARRQLALHGASDADIAHRLAEIARLAETGELNGRSAAYHRQLAALDLEAAWRAIAVPVLVLRGEHDWVVAADDQARLAELARGELVELPGLDHVLGAHADRAASLRDYGAGAADPRVAEAVIAWLERATIAT